MKTLLKKEKKKVSVQQGTAWQEMGDDSTGEKQQKTTKKIQMMMMGQGDRKDQTLVLWAKDRRGDPLSSQG